MSLSQFCPRICTPLFSYQYKSSLFYQKSGKNGLNFRSWSWRFWMRFVALNYEAAARACGKVARASESSIARLVGVPDVIFI